MKDYYYILGLSKEATLPEIQQAYKKLALKFHPEENGGDPFFAMHYAKIQEAYKILSDEHSRYLYDKSLKQEAPESKSKALDGPAPVITSFFASKKSAKKGDLLTISWEVLNADEVHINLIGEVATNGTQTIRLTDDFFYEAFLSIEIIASNKYSDKNSTKELTIRNLSEKLPDENLKSRLDAITQKNMAKNKTSSSKPNKIRPSYVEDDDDDDDEFIEPKKAKKKLSPPKKDLPPNRHGSGTAYLLVVMMIFIIFILLYILHSINPMF